MSGKEKFQYRKSIVIGFAHFMHDVYMAFLAPVLPLLIEKLNLNYSMVGLLTVIQRIPSFFMIFIGLLADRIRLRYVVIFTPLLSCVLMSLIGLTPNFLILAFLLFISGVSSALFHIPTPVMMKKVSGKRLGLGMSIYMVGGELARTMGPIIILAAITYWSFEGTYRLIPFGLAGTMFLFFALRNINVSDEIEKKHNESFIRVLKKYLPLMLIILGITFFRAIMKSALTTYLPIYLKSKGESLWFAGISLSVLEFAGVVGTFAAGYLSDLFGRKRLLLIVTIITPFLMYLFTNSQGIFIFPLLILLGFFIFATTPIILSMVVDNSSERPALINSIYMTVNFGGTSLASLIVGVSADIFTLQETYLFGSFVALGAIPFVIILKDNSI